MKGISMKTISIFNNKGGVGKTTLTFHLAHALATMGKKVLIIDLDPQCNISTLSVPQDWLMDVWAKENAYIDDFKATREQSTVEEFEALNQNVRSIHYLLTPTQEGTAEIGILPPPVALALNLHLIPGRLTMHLYEEKISSRWSDVYQGDPLAIRTITRIRKLAEEYAAAYGYHFVIMDTSPSIGALNKVVISTTDGFIIPCAPDMFSLYGIRNLGSALAVWQKQFGTIFHLLSEEKRKNFPEDFVKLLGFTIYNAKKYAGNQPWELAKAHYHYALQIPAEIMGCVPEDVRNVIPAEVLAQPIGGTAIMHTHNTLTGMSQKYHVPMWKVPAEENLGDDVNTVMGSRRVFEATLDKYTEFSKDLLSRIERLG
ncbi:ParA protein [Pseudomonas syringae pv. coriandricola]|uniref:ParA protein n=2 Tax=Pseudomonas syringae group TaxID=136849 RepID=A0A0P9P8A1_9PSED|nr:Cobyrinic acid a,c-diamide synthase [Pseudomonas syringae pv. coriandricola]RMN15009.1 ParA protein [Pseudomonas syringae pv. coriandricola]